MSDTHKSQSEKFKAVAREGEVDQDEDTFKGRLKKIARPPALAKPSKPGRG